MSDELRKALNSLESGGFKALARLLTIIEREGPKVLEAPELRSSSRPCLRLGVTGPPGAGKSTLIGKVLQELLSRGLKVGVLAVDPSSPFTRGAILGDRIRYSEFATSPNLFVRSIGSRGGLGGLSASTYLMLRAYDLMDFDLVLIETVGVGQSELEIMYVADTVSVVLVPESGDSIQTMKAGLLEIADHFVVNKSDRPGAESLARELMAAVHMGHSKQVEPKVYQTEAINGKGVLDYVNDMVQIKKDYGSLTVNRNLDERLKWEARSLLHASWEKNLDDVLNQLKNSDDLYRLLKEELNF